MKKLCILIVNHNSTRDTLNLIQNLKDSSYKNSDVLIFDNNSNEDLRKLEECGEVILIKSNKNFGLAGGVNKALEYIESKYVLLLNPDIEVDKEAVKELLELIEKDRKIAFVGGAIYNFNDKEKVNAFGGRINLFTGIGNALKDEKEIRELNYGEYTDACVMIFNKEIFQNLGGYDEKYFLYLETEDLQFKAMEKGYKIFINPRAKVWHKLYGSSGGKKNRRVVYFLTRNRFIFMKKHVSSLRYCLFLLISLFFILPMQFCLFIKRGHFDLMSAFFIGVYEGIRQKHEKLI